ncbi:MAG TPA: CbiX/SirB N-terminal domain-containing protein [Gemmatimonadales bacterium]|nr:CbiX/SirB N-terminal domain-containing protein [Gemmatimonadales bacterium]
MRHCVCTAIISLVWCLKSVAAQTGLLVVAHGADSGWNDRVRATIGQVQWSHGPVALAFLMGPEAESAGWDHAVDVLLAGRVTAIIVVPLMVSSYGGHYREIEYYSGLRDSMPGHTMRLRHHPLPVPARVTPALDSAAELGEALVTRWRELATGDRARPLVLVAHGPTDSLDAARWVANLRAASVPFSGAGLREPPGVGLLWDDAKPEARATAVAALRDTVNARASLARDSVVVLPVLISSGSIDREKLPRDLEGLPVRYLRASLAPLPPLARWIERIAGQALASTPGQGR